MTSFDVEAVRAEFPALAETDDGRRRTYLDNPAGTQVPRRVIDRMMQALVRCNANAGGRFATSKEATELSGEAHRAIADLFNAGSEREVVFGPNMTSLTFDMARSLQHLFHEGDEIIVTRMDHDGNSTPWRIMAAERGLVVRELPFDLTTYEFDLAELDSLISSRTRFAAINHASNITGTINDVTASCARLHDAGALTYVDAVQSAPHVPIDVQAIGCDLLAASPYKFYGPHQGVVWAREALLDQLFPYKLRVSPASLPARFETGTYSLEGQAGTLGAVEHLQWIGDTMGIPAAESGAPAGHRHRTRSVHAGLRAMAAYEDVLAARLIAGLAELGLTVHGITDPAAFGRRVPTVSVSKPGVDPAALSAGLAAAGVFVWDGNCYALDLVDSLGLSPHGGIVRFGPTHYNTLAEIDHALAETATLLGV